MRILQVPFYHKKADIGEDVVRDLGFHADATSGFFDALPSETQVNASAENMCQLKAVLDLQKSIPQVEEDTSL